MLNRAGVTRLPLLLHELRGGQRLRAASELIADAVMPGNIAGAALREIVLCNDEKSDPAYRQAASSANARSRPAFRRAANREDRECKEWVPRVSASPARTPVRSDIPTLIVTGYFDDRTPTEHGRRIASTLSRAYLAELPDEGHDARPGSCHAAIVQQFYADPSHAPDASCIEQIPPIRFAISWDAPMARR
jgi:pimeloyl-ACP methyl ester carboxylesterase